jgi:hypothetical protein
MFTSSNPVSMGDDRHEPWGGDTLVMRRRSIRALNESLRVRCHYSNALRGAGSRSKCPSAAMGGKGIRPRAASTPTSHSLSSLSEFETPESPWALPLLILPMKTLTDNVAAKESFSCSGLPVLFSHQENSDLIKIA